MKRTTIVCPSAATLLVGLCFGIISAHGQGSALWEGSVDENFNTPGNWSSHTVPDETALAFKSGKAVLELLAQKLKLNVPETPARKTIDSEGRTVKDGARKALRERQDALGALVKAIREFRKYTGQPLTLGDSEYASCGP